MYKIFFVILFISQLIQAGNSLYKVITFSYKTEAIYLPDLGCISINFTTEKIGKQLPERRCRAKNSMFVVIHNGIEFYYTKEQFEVFKGNKEKTLNDYTKYVLSLYMRD